MCPLGFVKASNISGDYENLGFIVGPEEFHTAAADGVRSEAAKQSTVSLQVPRENTPTPP